MPSALAGITVRSIPGWCGVTYCAYIEFVFAHPDVTYYTVDTDYGCGVIRKHLARERDDRLQELWRLERKRTSDIFEFYQTHRVDLLKLVSVRDFLDMENLRVSRVSRLWEGLNSRLRERRARLALWV